MQAPAPIRRRPAAGFTLVEMLVVIVVIGILAAMLSGAVVAARLTAKRAKDKMEVAQLAMALEKYKQEYGEYPPDLTFINHNMADDADPIRAQARNDLLRHVRKRWPRYTPTPLQLVGALANVGLAQPVGSETDAMRLRIYLDPASALAFWLGGIPESNTRLLPSGFHADPSNPIRTGSPRTERLFEFDETRFIWRENDPYAASYRAMRFYPPSATMPSGSGGVYTVNAFAPYVYFKSRRVAEAANRYEFGYDDDPTATGASSMVVAAYYMHGDSGGTVGVNAAVPYLEDSNPNTGSAATLCLSATVRNWRSLETFQVLCPGLDGNYGVLAADPNDPANAAIDANRYRFSRLRRNVSEKDLDNMASFSNGKLEDEMK